MKSRLTITTPDAAAKARTVEMAVRPKAEHLTLTAYLNKPMTRLDMSSEGSKEVRLNGPTRDFM